MEDSTEIKPSTQCMVFFNDQLLLKKGYTEKGEIKYSVPVSINPPLAPEGGSNIHDVFPPNGKQVRAFATGQPVAETEEWVMIGLRASYDYISADDTCPQERPSRYSIGTSIAISAPYAALLWSTRPLS